MYFTYFHRNECCKIFGHKPLLVLNGSLDSFDFQCLVLNDCFQKSFIFLHKQVVLIRILKTKNNKEMYS